MLVLEKISSQGDSLLMLGDEKQGIALVKQEAFFAFTDAIWNSKPIKESDEK